MTVPTEESKMRVLSIDKMSRTPSDTETDSPNPFNSSTNSDNTGDKPKGDLPF